MAMRQAFLPAAATRSLSSSIRARNMVKIACYSTNPPDHAEDPSPKSQSITGGKHRRHVARGVNLTSAASQPEVSQVHFEVVSKPGFHGQTEVELNLHGILDRLRSVLGDIPYGRTESTLSRTPLRVLPALNPKVRGSTITFKVFNGSQEQHEKVVAELEALPGIESARFAGASR
ncbi:Hypothetical predicted protein [Lecanosticta acicola]|uniref:Uncharacterized protein n=1 Tax=Lecanosticta acicola TaxID=111012 RepID=A0AAI8YVM7_9PEZI|nr:Hypothetical predicted protein [Lecanosticta acicola]